jgi:hypothetical protein
MRVLLEQRSASARECFGLRQELDRSGVALGLAKPREAASLPSSGVKTMRVLLSAQHSQFSVLLAPPETPLSPL